MADDIEDLDKNVLEVIAKQASGENAVAQPVALKVADRKRAEKKMTTKTTTTAPQVNVVIHQQAPVKQKKPKTQKKINTLKVTEKTTNTNQKSIAGSMDKLAKVVRQLVVLLSDLQKDTRTEKNKLWKKLEDLETQNEKIARGILAVADLVREQQATHENVEETKKQQMPPQRMSMNDLRLPGMQPQMQMPDRLPERQPLFLNKMPQFREVPTQNQQNPNMQNQGQMQFPQQPMQAPQQMPPYQQSYQQQEQQRFPPVQQQVNFPQPPIQQFKMPDLPLPMIKEENKEKDEIVMG